MVLIKMTLMTFGGSGGHSCWIHVDLHLHPYTTVQSTSRMPDQSSKSAYAKEGFATQHRQQHNCYHQHINMCVGLRSSSALAVADQTISVSKGQ
jgi:hypothetical protein